MWFMNVICWVCGKQTSNQIDALSASLGWNQKHPGSNICRPIEACDHVVPLILRCFTIQPVVVFAIHPRSTVFLETWFIAVSLLFVNQTHEEFYHIQHSHECRENQAFLIILPALIQYFEHNFQFVAGQNRFKIFLFKMCSPPVTCHWHLTRLTVKHIVWLIIVTVIDIGRSNWWFNFGFVRKSVQIGVFQYFWMCPDLKWMTRNWLVSEPLEQLDENGLLTFRSTV